MESKKKNPKGIPDVVSELCHGRIPAEIGRELVGGIKEEIHG